MKNLHRKQISIGLSLCLGFSSLFLMSACAMSDIPTGFTALNTMKAEQYFSESIQASFVTAVGHGETSEAASLLKKGGGVNAVGKDGMTPLLWAMSKQNLVGFRFLLSNGADPNQVSRWRNEKGQEEVSSPLEMAAILEDCNYLKSLLESGGNPNQVIDSVGKTPIFTAIFHKRPDNIELLLQHGADINHRTHSSTTPINHAVALNRFSLALMLLKHDADVSIKDTLGRGYSAIDTVMQFGNGGVERGSVDAKAYPEFVAVLKQRGLLKPSENPPYYK